MECKKIESKLLSFIDGKLQIAEQTAIREHLGQCESCRAKFEFLQSTLQVIDSEKAIKVKPFLYTRIQPRIDTPVKIGRQWVLAPALIAMVLLVGIVMGTLIGKMTITPRMTAETSYEVAYLFNDTQLESLEYKLLNNEE